MIRYMIDEARYIMQLYFKKMGSQNPTESCLGVDCKECVFSDDENGCHVNLFLIHEQMILDANEAVCNELNRDELVAVRDYDDADKYRVLKFCKIDSSSIYPMECMRADGDIEGFNIAIPVGGTSLEFDVSYDICDVFEVLTDACMYV